MRDEVELRTARPTPRMQALIRATRMDRRLSDRPAPVAAFWIRIYRRDWVTEEAACADRRRSLLQDNPTSG